MNDRARQIEFEFGTISSLPTPKAEAEPPARILANRKAEAARTVAEMVYQLQVEFDRLNDAYLGGTYSCPKIEFSRQKTFGGYYQKNRHRIVLSLQAFVEHGWEETLNTFRHEVAHIVHIEHNRAFWELATRLGATRKYAANPILVTRRPQKMLIYVCPACGALVRRRKQLRNASCARCDKSFNPKFKLKLVRNDSVG